MRLGICLCSRLISNCGVVLVHKKKTLVKWIVLIESMLRFIDGWGKIRGWTSRDRGGGGRFRHCSVAHEAFVEEGGHPSAWLQFSLAFSTRQKLIAAH